MFGPASTVERSSSWLIFAWILFLGCLVWVLSGAFPASTVERDGTHIALTAEALAEEGWDSPRTLYRYDVQAGVYSVLIKLRQGFGWDAVRSFAWLSAGGQLFFILFSAAFAHRVTRLPFPVCGVAVLLFQESWVGIYYPNSTALAAPFFAAGLWVSHRRQPGGRTAVWTGLLIGVSAWFRADVLCMGLVPLVPLVFREREGCVARGILFAGTSLGGVGLLLLLSRASLTRLIDSTRALRENPFAVVPDLGVDALDRLDVKSQLAFYSLVIVILALFGIAASFQRGRRLPLVSAMVGTASLYGAYLFRFGGLHSPKYLLYLVPLWTSLVALGARTLYLRRKRFGGALFLILVSFFLFLELFVGMSGQKGLAGKPSVWMGPGLSLTTDDGPRLLTGRWFLPPVWRVFKKVWNVQVEWVSDRLEEYELPRDPVCLLVLGDAVDSQALLWELQRRGFRPVGFDQYVLGEKVSFSTLLEREAECEQRVRMIGMGKTWKPEELRLLVVPVSEKLSRWPLSLPTLQVYGFSSPPKGILCPPRMKGTFSPGLDAWLADYYGGPFGPDTLLWPDWHEELEKTLPWTAAALRDHYLVDEKHPGPVMRLH